jgi:hypothetical protein
MATVAWPDCAHHDRLHFLGTGAHSYTAPSADAYLLWVH